MDEKINILLVEDEIIMAMLMKKLAPDYGLTVIAHATTGEKAIIKAKEKNPDLILMDIRLAGEIDGIETASRIKAESDIPVIFITGYDDKSVRERAEKIKPLAYIVKPLDMDELREILNKFFEKKCSEQQED